MVSRLNWNFKLLVFVEEGKPGNQWRRTFRAKKKTNHKPDPLMTPGLEFELGLHWGDTRIFKDSLTVSEDV